MKKSTILLGVCLLILSGLNFARQGYIVAGYSTSATQVDFIIYKLNADGHVQWGRKLGWLDDDYANSIQQTTDGGYVVAGSTQSYTHGTGDWDFLIYRLDGEGNQVWGTSYLNLGGISDDFADSIQQTSDGGYVVAGSTMSFTHGEYDFLIYKLDVSGRKQWRKNLGGVEADEAFSIRQTADGGYVVAGYTNSYTHGSGDYDFLIYKLDASGRKLWRKNLGGIADDQAWSIRQTTDGGYVVAGETQSYTHGSGDRDFLIYKLDAAGNKQWRKNLGGTSDDVANSIRQTINGGYVVAGYTDSYTHGGNDFLIYKLDASGNKQWRRNLGGTGDDLARSIQQTTDGGYVVAGSTTSYTNGGKDFIIYKLNADGNQPWGSGYIHLGGSLDDEATSIQQTVD